MPKALMHDSSRIVVTAGGTIVAGNVYKVGNLIGIAETSATSGQKYTLVLDGRHTAAPAEPSVAWTQGDVLYWDNTNGRFTKTTTSNTKSGYAASAKAGGAGDTVGDVILRQQG